MPLHAYKAMNAGGDKVTGRVDALNLLDLEQRLGRMGLDLIDGRQLTGGVLARGLFSRGAVSKRELIAFCIHFDQLIRAGVPIIDALTDLRDSEQNMRLRAVLANLAESIEGGRTLSEAMAGHPALFDGVFVNLIRAGELSGKLPETLRNLTESLKRQDELTAQMRRIAMYPAILGLMVVAVTLFLLLYLVPRIASFIHTVGQETPFHTRVLIVLSELVATQGYLVIVVPAMLAVALAMAVKFSPRARRQLDAVVLSLPWVGEIVRKTILARFAQVFAMLYASGIPVLDSIRITQDIAGNAVIREGLRQVEERIEEGQGIAAAFQSAGLFPPLVVRMIRTGENSGMLDSALENVGYFYTRDVREAIERMQAAIDPAATLVIGGILGWAMLAVLGPIYETITHLKY